MPGAQEVIGVDFGTTGVKAVLINNTGNILDGYTVSHDLHSPHAGGPRRIHGTGSTAHNYGAEGYRHNQVLRANATGGSRRQRHGAGDGLAGRRCQPVFPDP
ncbi:hypothetical protein BH24CHL4_BH24CHL4_09370 [soil metagenome]